jgi:hypothetical protein
VVKVAAKNPYKGIFSGQTAAYASRPTAKGISYGAVPKNALYRTYGPGGNLTVSGSHPVNQRWEYASPQDYRGYAKGVIAQQKKAGAAAAVAPAAASPGGSAVGAALSGTGGATAGGATNPFLTDPGYLSALAAEQTGSQQADNALRAAQEQAVVQFGDPSLAQAAGLNINPLTASMAAANTAAGTSTVAGYQRTRDENQQNILDSLAAHGMLDSGQTGYATTRNQEAYGRDVYGGLQAALSGLNTAAATDVSAKQGLHSDVTNALLGAYQTYVQNPQFWGAANTGGQVAAANTAATQPVTAALSPNNRAGPLGPRVPAPPRLATANAYAAGSARGGRAG